MTSNGMPRNLRNVLNGPAELGGSMMSVDVNMLGGLQKSYSPARKTALIASNFEGVVILSLNT